MGFLIYITILIFVGWTIFKIARKAWLKVDIEKRMTDIKDSKNTLNNINDFRDKYGSKDFKKDINKFANGH